MEEDIRKAWISHNRKTVSFYAMTDSIVIEKEESQFWDLICELINKGYRIM